MRRTVLFCVLLSLLLSCDDTRVYEKNFDFEQRLWLNAIKPEFEFTITDTVKTYNIYGNIRNSVSYPYSRIFFNYYLQDSIGLALKKDLVNHTLFDAKTGEPFGTSGLGDIYDHQILLLGKHRFPYAGTHKIRLEQYMRKDSLEGIFAVGVRVEMAEQE